MAAAKSVLNRHDWVQLHTALLEEERKAEVQAAQTQVRIFLWSSLLLLLLLSCNVCMCVSVCILN